MSSIGLGLGFQFGLPQDTDILVLHEVEVKTIWVLETKSIEIFNYIPRFLCQIKSQISALHSRMSTDIFKQFDTYSKRFAGPLTVSLLPLPAKMLLKNTEQNPSSTQEPAFLVLTQSAACSAGPA